MEITKIGYQLVNGYISQDEYQKVIEGLKFFYYEYKRKDIKR